MKIKASRNDILSLVFKAQNIVDKRNTMPVLANALLEVSDNQLTLYATDLEVSIKGTCKVEMLKEGKAVVNAKNFYDIIKELPEGELEVRKEENNSIVVEQGKAFFHIPGMNPDEYPVFPSINSNNFLKVKPLLIREMIEKTLYSVSNDESRYHLNGVLFESAQEDSKNSIRMVATDGHRLSLVDRELQEEMAEVFGAGVIVPKKGLNEIKKLLESEENVDIAVDGAQIVVKADDALLMVRLIEGKYPNYRQLLPKNLNLRARVNKERLVSSLKRVSLLSNQKSKGVTFNFSDGKVVIQSNSPDLGEAKEEFPVDYKEQDIKIGFNARYILDVLSAINEEEVELSFKDKSSPVLLSPVNDEKYKCVVMPMRI